MSTKSEQTVVISIGGSLVVPDGIDTTFLKNLKAFIEKGVAEGTKFVIIAGGGKTARRYQDAAAEVAELNAEDLDWLGIHGTRLNAHLLRTILRDVAYPIIISNPDEVGDVPSDVSVIVASGYRPGSSTDLRAVQIAKHLGARTLVNLSNIDYAYTDDPKKNPEAKPIEKMSWPDFRALLPTEWSPGLSSPFDPVAAKEAEADLIEVAIINGSKFNELDNYLSGKPFIGTLIR